MVLRAFLVSRNRGAVLPMLAVGAGCCDEVAIENADHVLDCLRFDCGIGRLEDYVIGKRCGHAKDLLWLRYQGGRDLDRVRPRDGFERSDAAIFAK